MSWGGNPENQALREIDLEHDAKAIEEAHAWATDLFREYSIKPESFVDLYGEDNVRKDLLDLARKEREFSETPFLKTSEVFEAVVLESEKHNWFGSNAETIKTSRFDDVINGTDLVVEFEEKTTHGISHLGLAVDVTFGTTGITKKLNRIQDEIKRGTLSRIKYFQSDKAHIRGERTNIPRIVVGVEQAHVIELARLIQLTKEKESRGLANEKLARHSAQRTLLEEASLQLKIFAEYAERIGKPDLAKIFRKDYAVVTGILNQKISTGIEDLPEDRVRQEIVEGLRIFKE